jgi:hypothetical protein
MAWLAPDLGPCVEMSTRGAPRWPRGAESMAVSFLGCDEYEALMTRG